eukprot:13384610-Alexandrium_andersonii.AAC.1
MVQERVACRVPPPSSGRARDVEGRGRPGPRGGGHALFLREAGYRAQAPAGHHHMLRSGHLAEHRQVALDV